MVDWRSVVQYSSENLGLESYEFNPEGVKQRVLVFAPHPTDEILGCGGTLIQHCQHDDELKVVYLTNGSKGNPSGTRDNSLINIRQNEAKSALEFIGGGVTDFWGFAEGAFDVNKTTIGLAKRIISDFKPNIIYLPWVGDNIGDHQSVTALLYKAASPLTELKFELWQYEIGSPLVPNRLVKIGSVLEQKKNAIEMYKSQVGSQGDFEAIIGLNTYRGFISDLNEPAEAYLSLSKKTFIDFCEKVLKYQL